MTEVFKHTFPNGNVVEVTFFHNDPSGETADILIRCLENEPLNQRFLCKIAPLEPTALILELRNDRTIEKPTSNQDP